MNASCPADHAVRGNGYRMKQYGGESQGERVEIPTRHDSKVEGKQTRKESSELDGTQMHRDAAADGDIAAAIPKNKQAAVYNAQVGSGTLPTIDTSLAPVHPPLVQRSPQHQSPATAGLHIQTNMADSPTAVLGIARLQETPTSTDPNLQTSLMSPAYGGGVGSSLRSNLSTSSMTSSLSQSSSTLPSPYLNAITDITPLPSPLIGSDSPILWKKPQPDTPTRSRQSSLDDTTPKRQSSLSSSHASPPRRRKGYGNLIQEAAMANAAALQENAPASASGQHGRNRSISDFVPEPLQNTRQRHVTFTSGDERVHEQQLHREAYLAEQRGLTVPQADPTKTLPTPPASISSMAESDEPEESTETPYLEDGTATEYLQIHCGTHNKRRKFRQLRLLGRGTFSNVMLATREKLPAHITPEIEDTLNPHKLVAVKIVAHGPAGGADEERIEISLKREVEMLKSVSHPSLVHLKGCEDQASRTLLVLTYCPGGDLFDLASTHKDVFTPHMTQRIFAELVSAVLYLHAQSIVHRDIKLENVLVNLPTSQLQKLQDPRVHQTPIVTLTDLGLSRRIPKPPESPFLTTRCGSEDYAAPEILLGQPYDGRSTDAWALGVLLYAMMEGRLPFDAPPGKPDRSRNTHRIARCDWIWCRFGDQDGDWDPARAQGFDGAQSCVEGLLKKVRMGRKPLDDIEKTWWVQDGVQVPGGLKMKAEDEDDELSWHV